MNKVKNDVRIIRRFIMGQKEPFCLVDIYHRAEREGITDRGLVLNVLDELYEEGLIYYDRINPLPISLKKSQWGFYVAS